MNQNLIQSLKDQEKLRDEFIKNVKDRYMYLCYRDDSFSTVISQEQYVIYNLTSPLDIVHAYSLVK